MQIFDIVRQQLNSGLDNQRQAAILLHAVEESIREQDQELVPVAYFAVLMTMIETASQQEIVSSACYLLSLVFSHVPTPVLNQKFTTITGLLDDSILDTFIDDAPIVKSVLACLEHLLIVQQNWKHDQKKVFSRILSISLDDRPKVRKRAAEAVKRIIASPPPPSLSHPGTITTIDFSINILQSYLDDNAGHKFQKDRHSKVLDVLVFLKLMISVFAKQSRNEKLALKLDSLARILLALPIKSSGSGDSVLTHWVFEVLDSLMEDKMDDSLAFSVVAMIVKALLEMRPHENDSVLTPSWLSLMTNGFDRIGESICSLESSSDDQDSAVMEFCRQYPEILANFFERIFTSFFNSTSKIKSDIIQCAANTLIGLIENGVSNSMVTQALGDYDSSLLCQMLKLLENSMNNINYRDHWGYLLKVVGSVFRRIGMDCPQFTQKLLKLVMNFRDDKSYGPSFPYKEELEECLHSAFQSLGMENFCSIVPLNIEIEDDETTDANIRRPYLLATFGAALNSPLSVSSWTPWKITGAHTLGYYISIFLPLANRLLVKSGKLWEDNRQLESKLFETLGLQIWDLFPLLCLNLPNDVPKSFGKIAPQLGKILTTAPEELYPNLPSQADLRPLVCLGLERLVETFSLFANLSPEEDDDTDRKKWKQAGIKLGTEAIAKMKSYVNRFLSALCNLYIAVDVTVLKGGKAKGQALQVMNEKAIQFYEKPIIKFLKIADSSNVSEYFMTMANSVQAKPFSSCSDVEKLGIYATFDLMLIFLPHLSNENWNDDSPLKVMYNILFAKLKETDATMQKKTYKILLNLFNYLPLTEIDQHLLVKQLLEDDVVSQITSGASKLRVKLIQLIVEQSLDKNLLLSFIPQSLPEIMLATKEANEKSRDAAYDCIIAMAKKMKMEADAVNIDEMLKDSSVSDISIKEFFVMVTAGLGGESAHMQSASIASLGRLLFEFHEELEPTMIQELIKTVMITMSFKNREVAKAALGFIKVAVVCLPLDLLELELNIIVKTILSHSRDHKSHFKSKVRHIFERLIRKFGFDRIDGLFPEEDKKLILNIKKRRESSKRRAIQKRDEERDEGSSKAKPAKFEEAFHDSGSELGSDDDEGYIPEPFRNETLTKMSSKTPMTIIREDEEVVDFLDRNVVSQIAHSSSKISKMSKVTRSGFPTNNDGMLVFDQEDSDDEKVKEVSEDYYKKSLASEVSFTRGADGRVKFLKRKRQQDDNAQDGDQEIGKRWHAAKDKHSKPENYSKMLGSEYKSKKAKGDVKRAGMADPHAFIPLSGKIVGNMNKTTKLDGTLKNILKAATKGGSVKARPKMRGGKGISKENKKHRK